MCPLSRFTYCPIESRFIDTIEDACSYYAHRLVGGHRVTVHGAQILVRFNPEETHLFTDERSPCPDGETVLRKGGRERRCFARDRARLMDRILPTIEAPAACLRARGHPQGVQLFGPPDPGARRLCVLLHPSRWPWQWYVRSSYPADAKSFVNARRSNRPAQWPPKKKQKPRSPFGTRAWRQLPHHRPTLPMFWGRHRQTATHQAGGRRATLPENRTPRGVFELTL